MSADYMAWASDGGAPLRIRDAADKKDAERRAREAFGDDPARVDAIPYPFCWDPTKCAGNGYCNKDRACND